MKTGRRASLESSFEPNGNRNHSDRPPMGSRQPPPVPSFRLPGCRVRPVFNSFSPPYPKLPFAPSLAFTRRRRVALTCLSNSSFLHRCFSAVPSRLP
ncbi:hypothetical protein LX36DRAFT_422097 [Colletotrichum falcatum]|nr:hypothetical protein LX36DRAFT_422097 [Colletotrichum falcatum]